MSDGPVGFLKAQLFLPWCVSQTNYFFDYLQDIVEVRFLLNSQLLDAANCQGPWALPEFLIVTQKVLSVNGARHTRSPAPEAAAAEAQGSRAAKTFKFRTDARSEAYIRRIDDTIAALKTSGAGARCRCPTGRAGARARPLAGPVVPLTSGDSSESDELLGGNARSKITDAVATRSWPPPKRCPCPPGVRTTSRGRAVAPRRSRACRTGHRRVGQALSSTHDRRRGRRLRPGRCRRSDHFLHGGMNTPPVASRFSACCRERAAMSSMTFRCFKTS
jgi:hypothetical protein